VDQGGAGLRRGHEMPTQFTLKVDGKLQPLALGDQLLVISDSLMNLKKSKGNSHLNEHWEVKHGLNAVDFQIWPGGHLDRFILLILQELDDPQEGQRHLFERFLTPKRGEDPWWHLSESELKEIQMEMYERWKIDIGTKGRERFRTSGFPVPNWWYRGPTEVEAVEAGLFGAAAKGSSSAGVSGVGCPFGLWRGMASRGRRRSVILYYMLNDAYASEKWDMFPYPPTEDFVARLHTLCMCLSFLRRVHVFAGGVVPRLGTSICDQSTRRPIGRGSGSTKIS